MNILDKFSTVKFSDDLESAVVTYKFGFLKLKHKIKDRPILNKKLCNKAGFKTLLISRFGGVGDFLLFRPFLKFIKKSKKFSDYKIILVTLPEYIDLVKKFDENVVDYFIPIESFGYKNKNVYKLFKCTSFNIYIDPSDGLKTGTRDTIVKTIDADDEYCNVAIFTYSKSKKIGVNLDSYFNKHFNHVFYNSDCPIFIKDINKAFFEFVAEEKFSDISSIKDNLLFNVDFRSKYAVISPFARGQDRTYPPDKYSIILDYITDVLKIPVVLIGSELEKCKADELIDLCKNQHMIFNLSGKLTYFESMFYIKYAQFMVANETGTVHIAQGLGTKTICISNGSYMGTFHPYPKDISSAIYVYPDDINEVLTSHPEYVGVPFKSSFEHLSPQKVIESLKSVL